MTAGVALAGVASAGVAAAFIRIAIWIFAEIVVAAGKGREG